MKLHIEVHPAHRDNWPPELIRERVEYWTAFGERRGWAPEVFQLEAGEHLHSYGFEKYRRAQAFGAAGGNHLLCLSCTNFVRGDDGRVLWDELEGLERYLGDTGIVWFLPVNDANVFFRCQQERLASQLRHILYDLRVPPDFPMGVFDHFDKKHFPRRSVLNVPGYARATQAHPWRLSSATMCNFSSSAKGYGRYVRWLNECASCSSE